MATYREIIYMVLDELKVLSDDSYFNEEHVRFLLNKYRAYLLKQKYANQTKEGSSANEQTICVNLQANLSTNIDLCLGPYLLKSTHKIPEIIDADTLDRFVKISSIYTFYGEFAFVTPERFKYVGHNRWTKNMIYCTLGPDDYLYFKSYNQQFMYLNMVKMTAIFEDPDEAIMLSCEEGEKPCDPYDFDFPLEAALVPQAINFVMKDLLGAAWRPKDDVNNANDDLSNMASFVRRNLKSDIEQQLYGEEPSLSRRTRRRI